MIKRLGILASILLLCVFYAACKAPDTLPVSPESPAKNPESSAEENPAETSGGNQEEYPVSHSAKIPAFELEPELANACEYELSEFDLGSRVYSTQSGRDMPYKLRGVIGVPEGEGPFPVVFITHGSHENIDESKRFDTGYEYLVSALAQNGYIAVSMDMSAPYIWKYGDGDDAEKSAAVADAHIKNILAANAGEQVFPVELEGRVDSGRIALIGHSRGGETIFRIAQEQRENGVDISALLPVAPAWDTMREFPDVNAAIIVPQYDGDVTRLDGIALYDYLVKNNSGDFSVTFLHGANHNFFNRNIEKDDTMTRGLENTLPVLTRGEQESVLACFAVSYLNAVFGMEDNFYRLSDAQPDKIYGRAATRRVRMKNAADLIDVHAPDAFTGAGEAVITHVTDSWFFREDEVLIDTVTIGMFDDEMNMVNLNRDLIEIRWQNTGSSAVIKPLLSDFTGGSSISIDLVPDSASEMGGDTLRFSVLIRDAKGNSSSLEIAENQRLLTKQSGELVVNDYGDFTVEYWSPPTPPGSLNIPLTLFEGVDLAAVESIELLFDQSGSGTIYIGAVVLQ